MSLSIRLRIILRLALISGGIRGVKVQADRPAVTSESKNFSASCISEQKLRKSMLMGIIFSILILKLAQILRRFTRVASDSNSALIRTFMAAAIVNHFTGH